MKCLREECPFYFESDDWTTCNLVLDKVIKKDCIGYEHIQDKQEEIAGEILVLTNKYDRLERTKEKLDRLSK